MNTTELTRWEKYRRANNERPLVRENELRHMFALVAPHEGEHIWEVGTGNGYLTFPLARATGVLGEVVTTDVEEGNCREVESKNKTDALTIRTILLPLEKPYLGSEYSGLFDAVTSIATFHHFDDRRHGRGQSGRMAALKAFYSALKPGGRIIMADPFQGSSTQRYFDAIDNPRFCAPHGHPHDFVSLSGLQDMAQEVGFRDIVIEPVVVPWQFSSVSEAQSFVHTIHNATCSKEESFTLAEKILGFKKIEKHYELGWELFYLTAKK